MLVGLPGTGKSTWVNQSGYYDFTGWFVLSTDNYIESVAVGSGKTYNEVFQASIKDAEKNLNEGLEYAIDNNMNIVWDQTNLSIATRAKKLRKIPKHYKKIARVFALPVDHDQWLNSIDRRGKIILPHIIDTMRALYQEPTTTEGFEEVIFNQ